jgi:hypothetical protein
MDKLEAVFGSVLAYTLVTDWMTVPHMLVTI